MLLTVILSVFVVLVHTAEPCFGAQGSGHEEQETVIAVDPTGPDASYAAIIYDNTNGLPTSEANDIAETEEGFIWIGGYSGLIRYDGNSFERMDSVSTGISSVKRLFVDSRNRLWVGTNTNGVVMMDNEERRAWTVEDGLPAASVRSIIEDDRGVFYISTTGGIATIDQEWNLSVMDDPHMRDTYILDLTLASDGRIYAPSNSGDLFVLKDGAVESFYNKEIIEGDGAQCVFPDPEKSGYVYIVTMDDKIRYGSLADGVQEMEVIDIAPLSQVASFACINDRIWICARNGIGVLGENGFQTIDNLPMNYGIGRIMTDYEGNVWVTSDRQGVMKIVPNMFVDLFYRYDLSADVVNSTCMLDGTLYIGTDSGLRVLGEDGVVEEIPLTHAETALGQPVEATDLIAYLDSCRIRSIIRDSQDRLWISTWLSAGLLCYDHGKLTVFTYQDGLFSDKVRAVYEMEDGRFIVANTGGVKVIRDKHVEASYSASEGIDNLEILTVAEGENGDILCGTDGAGIYVISEEGVRHIGREEGLSSEIVMRIKPDKKRGLYWVVTGASLACLTADYEVRDLDKFPYTNNFDLYENDKGEMWVLSSNGINIVSVEELMNNEEMEPLNYGISNGLPCITTANSYSEMTKDGDLYIAGSTGVAKVNMNQTVEGSGELKAAVPYVEADGVRVYPDESGDFSLSPDVRKLTIYPFVFNYSLIDPQVTYCLNGFDRQGIRVMRSELGSLDYTNLRGGEYAFTMEVRDPLRQQTKELSVKINKKRAFYERAWFYLLSVGLLIFCISVGVKKYLKREIRLLEEKNREQAEKERIATELDMAKRIQGSVLPNTFPAFPDRQDFDIYASMDPAREVGGDFYDYFLIDDDHLCLVMADVSGKGIPAALFMMEAKSTIKSRAMLSPSPSQILERANDDICASNEMEMFVTVWLGILELSSGKLTTANAGHEYPALKRADGMFELQKSKHGLVVGAMEGIRYRENEAQLYPGDKIFLYTDGVPEATDANQELFGTDRMIAALNRDPDAGPREILDAVRASVDAFVKDEEQFDDLTMMCVEYKGTRQITEETERQRGDQR